MLGARFARAGDKGVAVQHMGDNLTGAGDGDDEQVRPRPSSGAGE